MEGSSIESIHEQFAVVEKMCLGFDDYIDAEEKNYLLALDLLRKLVKQIQLEGIFSKNESLPEIDTEFLKFLLVPFYEADTQCRIMDKRKERLELA
jgi:hypothetical protein